VTMLVLLYPHLAIVRIVGTDIAHAVPLTLVAGLRSSFASARRQRRLGPQYRSNRRALCIPAGSEGRGVCARQRMSKSGSLVEPFAVARKMSLVAAARRITTAALT